MAKMANTSFFFLSFFRYFIRKIVFFLIYANQVLIIFSSGVEASWSKTPVGTPTA